MSVLLEALKKAAAEKKKAMGNTGDSETVLSDSNKVSDTVVSPVLKLSTEEIEATASIDEPSSIAVEDDVKVEAPLTFTLSNMSTPVSNQDDVDLGISELSVPLESSDLVSDDVQHSSEESAQLLKKDQLKAVDSSGAQDELSQNLFQVTAADLSDSETPQPLDSRGSNLFEADKDSFEWSMNALPGYSAASVDDSVPIEKNSILLTGALTSEPKAKKKINSRGLLALIVVLMFIGICVYGLIYYQKKSEQLENSMRKYELAKIQTPLPKKQRPLSPAVDSSLQKTKESSSKLDATPVVTTTTANHSSEMANSNITADNFVMPLARKELATATMDVSNKGTIKSKVAHTSIKKKAAYPITKPILVKVDKTRIILAEAYSAYELGQLELSQQKFREVLSFDSKNITAMIGLGGIAASSGQYYVAMDYYQKALNIEPNSLDVYEAIANLSPNIELNSDWYDSLKNMVTIYPNSAALQFALGNLYASSNDWLAAQESYFNAYALDMNNPDFTVNLAISLDRLGKYPLAAQYYTQALALAGSNKVNFNVSDIKNRLISIRQFIDQEK